MTRFYQKIIPGTNTIEEFLYIMFLMAKETEKKKQKLTAHHNDPMVDTSRIYSTFFSGRSAQIVAKLLVRIPTETRNLSLSIKYLQ